VAVQVLAGPVIPHGGARVGVTAAGAGSARTARRLPGLPGRHRPVVVMPACRYAGPMAGSLQRAPVVKVMITML
jgi:hypothetical protein